MVAVRNDAAKTLAKRCELCGGVFRLWDERSGIYECDGCGTTGRPNVRSTRNRPTPA